MGIRRIWMSWMIRFFSVIRGAYFFFFYCSTFPLAQTFRLVKKIWYSSRIWAPSAYPYPYEYCTRLHINDVHVRYVAISSILYEHRSTVFVR